MQEFRVDLPGLGIAAAIRAALPTPISVYSIFVCSNIGTTASVWDFNVCTAVDACDCTRGLYGQRKRVCTESWLWKQNPLPHRGLEPASVLRLAFQSDAPPTDLSRPRGMFWWIVAEKSLVFCKYHCFNGMLVIYHWSVDRVCWILMFRQRNSICSTSTVVSTGWLCVCVCVCVCLCVHMCVCVCVCVCVLFWWRYVFCSINYTVIIYSGQWPTDGFSRNR